MNNEIYKLRQELANEEKRVENAKTKRCIITILCFAAVFFIMEMAQSHENGINISVLEFIGGILASVFMAGIYFWINAIIFSALASKAQSEDRMLENIRKQIAELEEKERDEQIKKEIAERYKKD